MDILFVTTELAPVHKASSLADSVFSLSKTLRNLGHKVTIALPKTPAFDRAGVLAARRLTPLQLAAAGPSVPREVTVFDGRLASGVDLVLFDAKLADGTPLFEDGALSEAAPGELDAVRASVFSRAVVELMRQRVAADLAFDVVNAHDWQSAMVPYAMRLVPELTVTRSVLTLHDVRAQGMFERDAARTALAAFGLGADHFTPSTLEFYGGLNLLKGGVLAADAVTTVSPAYAREILTPEGGARLDGVLRARRTPVTGIAHGIDYAVWNPASDPALVARYDGDDPSNKTRDKTNVLAELGLDLDPARPLFVYAGQTSGSRPSDDGSDVLAAAAARLLKQDLTLVTVGATDPDRALPAAVRRAPERMKVLDAVDDATLHRMLAAADFVLLPSRYAPCATMQQRAQRYGAVPLATATSGYLDSIVDLDAALETGTGFLLDPPTSDAIAGGVGRALAAFAHPRFGTVRRRVMRLDVGWDRPARRYLQVYKQVVDAEVQRTASQPASATT